MTRMLPMAGVVALLVGVAQADHHDGSAKLGNRIHRPGTHHIHSTPTHHVHAHVNGNRKVSGITATHKQTRQAAPTKKFKTRCRQHARAGPNDGITHGVTHIVVDADGTFGEASPSAADVNAPESQQIVFVGFGFFGGGQWYIFWFPIHLVEGGDAGADDYDTGNLSAPQAATSAFGV